MKKKTKIAIITFVVLGVSGVAILKAHKYYSKRRVKKGKTSKNSLLSQLLDLPEDLRN